MSNFNPSEECFHYAAIVYIEPLIQKCNRKLSDIEYSRNRMWEKAIERHIKREYEKDHGWFRRFFNLQRHVDYNRAKEDLSSDTDDGCGFRLTTYEEIFNFRYKRHEDEVRELRSSLKLLLELGEKKVAVTLEQLKWIS